MEQQAHQSSSAAAAAATAAQPLCLSLANSSGVDGGTESIRAGVFDLEGTPLSFASAPYPTSFPAPGWAEQAPADWWAGLGAAVKQAVSKAGVDPSAVGAICVDTTCCTVVALDAAGQVRRRRGLTDTPGRVWAPRACMAAACAFALLPPGPADRVCMLQRYRSKQRRPIACHVCYRRAMRLLCLLRCAAWTPSEPAVLPQTTSLGTPWLSAQQCPMSTPCCRPCAPPCCGWTCAARGRPPGWQPAATRRWR